jgi:hypothetical protein
MALTDLLNHLLNLLAPAIWVAFGVAMLGRWWFRPTRVTASVGTLLLVNLVVCTLTLVAGLWWLGRDGKMATYAAMVVLSATVQWLATRGWQRK